MVLMAQAQQLKAKLMLKVEFLDDRQSTASERGEPEREEREDHFEPFRRTLHSLLGFGN